MIVCGCVSLAFMLGVTIHTDELLGLLGCLHRPAWSLKKVPSLMAVKPQLRWLGWKYDVEIVSIKRYVKADA